MSDQGLLEGRPRVPPRALLLSFGALLVPLAVTFSGPGRKDYEELLLGRAGRDRVVIAEGDGTTG